MQQLERHSRNITPTQLMKHKQSINPQLQSYIEKEVFPQYVLFDKGHNINHIRKVIEDSLEISQQYDADINMVYTIAAYHDIGMSKGRENHHITSGEILRNDKMLSDWFDEKQLIIMQEAVEDHRASNSHEPRSMYGKIVAEADRDISPETIVCRSIAFSMSNYHENNYEEHLKRVYAHIEDKYGENGYLKLWLETSKNTKGLQEVRSLLRNKQQFEQYFAMLWNVYSHNC